MIFAIHSLDFGGGGYKGLTSLGGLYLRAPSCVGAVGLKDTSEPGGSNLGLGVKKSRSMLSRPFEEICASRQIGRDHIFQNSYYVMKRIHAAI